MWRYSVAQFSAKSRANHLKPAKNAIFFSTLIEPPGTVIIKFLCFSAPQRVSYGILDCNNCTSDCADIALHLCQRCTKKPGGESATSGIPPTPEKKFRVASVVEVYSLHFCAPSGWAAPILARCTLSRTQKLRSPYGACFTLVVGGVFQ